MSKSGRKINAKFGEYKKLQEKNNKYIDRKINAKIRTQMKNDTHYEERMQQSQMGVERIAAGGGYIAQQDSMNGEDRPTEEPKTPQKTMREIMLGL